MYYNMSEGIILKCLIAFIIGLMVNRYIIEGLAIPSDKPCALYDAFVWAGNTSSKDQRIGPQLSRTYENNLVEKYMDIKCKNKLEANCSNVRDPMQIISKDPTTSILSGCAFPYWGSISNESQIIEKCGPHNVPLPSS